MTKQEFLRWADLQGDGAGEVLFEVAARELALLRPAVRAQGAEVTELLHEEFREFGSSGRTWDREEVIEALTAEAGDCAPEVDELRAVQPDDLALLTYRASGPDRVTLRSSLWVRGPVGSWQLLFHQGTVCP